MSKKSKLKSNYIYCPRLYDEEFDFIGFTEEEIDYKKFMEQELKLHLRILKEVGANKDLIENAIKTYKLALESSHLNHLNHLNIEK